MSYAYPPDSTVTSAVTSTVNSPEERDIEDYFSPESFPPQRPPPKSPTAIGQELTPTPVAPSSVERFPTTSKQSDNTANMEGDILDLKHDLQRIKKAEELPRDDAGDVMNMGVPGSILWPPRAQNSDASPGIAITDPELSDTLSLAGVPGGEVEEKPGGQRDSPSPVSATSYFGASPMSISEGWQSSPPVPTTPSPSDVSVPRTRSSVKQVSFSYPDAFVMDKASSKHVSFDDRSSTQLDTPFTKTLNHLRRLGGKENSPSKPRRNASLPEEIAELAREASEAECAGVLHKHHQEDLTPTQTTMESENSGGIIVTTAASPQAPLVREFNYGAPSINVASTPSRFGSISPSALKDRAPPTPSSEEVILETGSPSNPLKYELEIPGHYGEMNRLKVSAAASTEQIADFIRIKAEELNAASCDIEKAVENFCKYPGSYMVDEAEEGDKVVNAEYVKEAKKEDDHPTFIKIIGMLPLAMVLAVAYPVARYTDQAFNSVMQTLGLLSLDEDEEE